MTGAKKAGLLTEAERELWHALKHLSDVAFAAVANVLEVATGLSGADYGVLSRLEDLGDGVLPQRQLQGHLGWDKSRLSHQLTRMEQRRLLRRVRMKSGRGVSVAISRDGRMVIEAARPVHAKAIREHVLRHVQPGEAEMLIRMVRRMQGTHVNAVVSSVPTSRQRRFVPRPGRA